MTLKWDRLGDAEWEETDQVVEVPVRRSPYTTMGAKVRVSARLRRRTDHAEPTIEPSPLPAHIRYVWPDRTADLHLTDWSGYVADGVHRASPPTIETDPRGAWLAFAAPPGDTVTWLDGERVPVWAILAERAGGQPTSGAGDTPTRLPLPPIDEA